MITAAEIRSRIKSEKESADTSEEAEHKKELHKFYELKPLILKNIEYLILKNYKTDNYKYDGTYITEFDRDSKSGIIYSSLGNEFFEFRKNVKYLEDDTMADHICSWLDKYGYNVTFNMEPSIINREETMFRINIGWR